MWQSCFKDERPEAVAWGFRKYFKTGTFPPKPADIAGLIRANRESPYFEGWNSDLKPNNTSEASVAEYRRRTKESRQEFFDSPEYKAFLERMKREHGI